MNMFEATVPQFKKMLNNLDAWMTKAVVHAKNTSFDPNVFVNARLAPDQYPLVRQVQSACDSAKFAAARLAGKEAPKHPDTETTMEELHVRVKSVVTYLETLKLEDFQGAETRTITLPFMPGKACKGADYLVEMAMPNFYFHVTTAYSILRHNGVDVGKMDFIGSLNLQDC